MRQRFSVSNQEEFKNFRILVNFEQKRKGALLFVFYILDKFRLLCRIAHIVIAGDSAENQEGRKRILRCLSSGNLFGVLRI